MTNGDFNASESKTAFSEELAFWDLSCDGPHELVVREDSAPLVYDLEERTAVFGEKIVLFAKTIPWTPVNNRLIDQLVGEAPSIGANYCEADDGVSRADFKHRIGTCRKEERETKSFLRMLATSEPLQGRRSRTVERRAFAPSYFQPNLAQHEHLSRQSIHHPSFVIWKCHF
jgi:four helix bundle protein